VLLRSFQVLPRNCYPDDVVGLVGGASPLGPVPVPAPVLEDEPEPDLLPILGQFLVDPEEDVPLELTGGVGLVDPDEFVEVPLPVDELVPVELVELVLDVLVAALATSAPPVTRPPVSALIARTLRR
jgi:hypothetical protein